MTNKANNASMAVLSQRLHADSYRSAEHAMKNGYVTAAQFYQLRQARDHHKMFAYLLAAINAPRVDTIDDLP